MNTLTRFFYQEEQRQMQEHAISQIAALKEHSFETIENETITNRNYVGYTISGSLFSFAIFSNVTFENCTFYANKMENCIFENCEFIDCNFEFTNFSHCHFVASELENTSFAMSNLQGGSFRNCSMEAKLESFLKTQNINLQATELLEKQTSETETLSFGFEEMDEFIVPSAA